MDINHGVAINMAERATSEELPEDTQIALQGEPDRGITPGESNLPYKGMSSAEISQRIGSIGMKAIIGR